MKYIMLMALCAVLFSCGGSDPVPTPPPVTKPPVVTPPPPPPPPSPVIVIPVVTTVPISLITNTTAVSGGTISSDGGASITSKGVFWGTSPSPTILKTTDGTGTSSFVSNITQLTQGIKYYVRAYAVNSAGIGYGNEISFTTTSNFVPGPTDIDGNTYKAVVIGTQVWMAEDLKTTKYANGDPINNITDNTLWNNATAGAWSYFNNDPSKGKLYNWFVTQDVRNVCPQGYHMPNNVEWATLETYLGVNGGGKLKSLDNWISPNTGATNETGFTALPTGSRGNSGFGGLGIYGVWWSSTSSSPSTVSAKSLKYDQSVIGNDNNLKVTGNSIRCLSN
jgi:uncharacterized protein (TIGR02145 family)